MYEERNGKMNISRISIINFNGVASKAMKKAVKSADEKLTEEVSKQKEDFVNYNQSSYSVPTGVFPKKRNVVQRYPFTPEDNVITKADLIKDNVALKSAEEKVDFVSESSIM